MKQKKLSYGNRHILTLIVKDEGADGWTPVSATVSCVFKPDFQDPLPPELFVFEQKEDGTGRVKLTDAGRDLIKAMEYI